MSNDETEYRTKWNDLAIIQAWLSIDANRNKLLHLVVDEATWNAFRNYGTVIDFTERELDEGLMYCSIGGEWVCLKKQTKSSTNN